MLTFLPTFAFYFCLFLKPKNVLSADAALSYCMLVYKSSSQYFVKDFFHGSEFHSYKFCQTFFCKNHVCRLSCGVALFFIFIALIQTPAKRDDVHNASASWCVFTSELLSVCVSTGPGPRPFPFNIALVLSQNIYLYRPQSMCSICFVVFVYFM